MAAKLRFTASWQIDVSVRTLLAAKRKDFQPVFSLIRLRAASRIDSWRPSGALQQPESLAIWVHVQFDATPWVCEQMAALNTSPQL